MSSATTTTNLEQIVLQLEACVTSGDVMGGKRILSQAKLALLSSHNNNIGLTTQALECGVLLSLADGDLDAFSRHISLLLPYYYSNNNNDDNDSQTPTSTTTDRRNHILGLHLMHLLVEHRLAEFHSALEVIPEREASTSPYLSFPIALERQLMVGMYDEIFRTPIPHVSYQFFVDQKNSIRQTVRDSIADGFEVAYESLSLTDAAQMMKMDENGSSSSSDGGVQALLEYIREYRDDWIVEGLDDDGGGDESRMKLDSDHNLARITFSPVETTLTSAEIAAGDWIQQSLQYAAEMERIV